MTKEDETIEAARVYANGIAPHSLNEKYCEEDFIAGAMWRQTHPHWISVEDELPKIEEADCEWVGSKDVLALLWNGEMSVGRHERDNSTGDHYWVLYNVDKDHQVTHWMPLPSVEHLKKGGKE